VSKQPTSSKCNLNASKDTKACSATQIQVDNKQFSCYYCKNPTHTIYKCAEFLNLSHHDKIQNLNNRNLCKNCFRPNHSTADCRSKFKCKYCHKKKSNILYANESKNADELIQCTASVIDGFLAAVTGSVLLEPSVVLQPRSARVLGPGGR
jgi:hypothetical protein